jgi:hypothetical protein
MVGETMQTNTEKLAFIIGAVLVVITGIACTTYYQHYKIESMKSNIESAIVKGIDPLAVRCAYEQGDTVCVAYAISHGKVDSPSVSKK